MIYLIFPTIISLIVFIILKKLQYKNKIHWLVVLFIILGLQIIFTLLISANVITANIISEKQYLNIVDPTGGNDGIFNYNRLTNEEKKIVDYYFQDSGRNLSPIIFGIYFLFNFTIFLIISITMDLIRKQGSIKYKHETNNNQNC